MFGINIRTKSHLVRTSGTLPLASRFDSTPMLADTTVDQGFPSLQVSETRLNLTCPIVLTFLTSMRSHDAVKSDWVNYCGRNRMVAFPQGDFRDSQLHEQIQVADTKTDTKPVKNSIRL